MPEANATDEQSSLKGQPTDDGNKLTSPVQTEQLSAEKECAPEDQEVATELSEESAEKPDEIAQVEEQHQLSSGLTINKSGEDTNGEAREPTQDESPVSSDEPVNEPRDGESVKEGAQDEDSVPREENAEELGEDSVKDIRDTQGALELQPETDDEEQGDEEAEDEGQSSETSEEDEEEEEAMPRLRYKRLKGLDKAIPSKDSISSCLFTDGFYAFATHTGIIHVLRPNMTPLRMYKAHQASVLALSTDHQYVGSASMDGIVVIASISDQSDNIAKDYKRPMNSIALDPHYKHSKIYIAGGRAGKVLYSEKNWFGTRTEVAINDSSSESSILALAWIADLLIWVDESGIYLYNATSKSVVLYIGRPESAPHAELYRPRIVTSPEINMIFIAWANTVWALRYRETKQSAASATSRATKMLATSTMAPVSVEVEIDKVFDLGQDIACGCAPLSGDTLMVLTLAPPSEGSRRYDEPELRLLDMSTGEVVYNDVVEINGYQRLRPNDYFLQYTRGILPGPYTARFFIVGGNDAVIINEVTPKDQLEWFVERQKYENAWEMSFTLLSVKDRADLGSKAVTQMVDNEEWDSASKMLAQVVENAKDDELCVIDLWTYWTPIFLENHKIDKIIEDVPKDLPIDVVDTILKYYLKVDKHKFVKLIESWPVENFSANNFEQLLEDELSDNPSYSELEESLAHLYVRNNQPVRSVKHLLNIHSSEVLQVISEYHLLPLVVSDLAAIATVALSDLNDLKKESIDDIKEKILPAIQLFVDARHEVLPPTVVDHLKDPKTGDFLDMVAFLYLEQLKVADPYAAKGFGDLQVKLYAEFDRTSLGLFLRKNNNYRIDTAMSICESWSYIPELVYLLARAGQHRKAMKLITEDLNDPLQAVQFAKEQEDREIWNYLIKFAQTRPPFILALLESAGASIDLLPIVESIPENMEIPGVKNALVRIFQDLDVAIELHQGILNIVNREAIQASKELKALRSRGREFELEENTDLDILQTIVITPSGNLTAEDTLLGEKSKWKPVEVSPGHVAGKINHLRYLKRRLMALKRDH